MAIFTDNEYSEYDSDYNEYEEDDNEDEDEEDDNEDEEAELIIYNGDEASGTRFNVILCEIYNNKKHGLNNINVSNVASFMKDLQMNWSKLNPELKDKVLDIMVDGIFVGGDYDFKNRFLSKLGVNSLTKPTKSISKTNFLGKSNFGSTSSNLIALAIILIGIIIFVLMKKQNNLIFTK